MAYPESIPSATEYPIDVQHNGVQRLIAVGHWVGDKSTDYVRPYGPTQGNAFFPEEVKVASNRPVTWPNWRGEEVAAPGGGDEQTGGDGSGGTVPAPVVPDSEPVLPDPEGGSDGGQDPEEPGTGAGTGLEEPTV